MNTSKSLPALLGYYFNHWSSAASIGDVEAMKRIKGEAATAIVEAVEGLINETRVDEIKRFTRRYDIHEPSKQRYFEQRIAELTGEELDDDLPKMS